MDGADPIDGLSDAERATLEEIERGLEHIHRAHGSLVAFHHAVGHAMDHFQAAEQQLDGEPQHLARRLDEEILPAGVTADGKLSYQVVAEFETGLLQTVEETADDTFEQFADGRRYPLERRDASDLS